MSRLRNLLRRRRTRLERDLERELQYHLDRRVDDMMANGLGEADARRQARIEFGGVAQVQEDVRDTWIWQWLDALVLDVRYAVRGLVRHRGFTLGAGTVLALALGATIAIFSVVNTVLLQPLAYPDADRLVSVETFWTNTGRPSQDVSAPDFVDWQAQNDVFETMAHFSGEEDVAVVVGDRPEFANDMYVSGRFFEVFGQPAAAGRLLTERDVPAGDALPAVVVVRHQWAEAQFGSADAAIGRTIVVYDLPLQIVGVAAPGFSYPGATDLWAPWRTTGTNRSAADFHVVGKLEAGVSLARARARMRAIGDDLAQRHPENRLKTVAVIPLQERLTGNVRVMLWLLLGAVIAVWLIACANIANLLLARATGRTREMALRASLGAGRGRLVRQLLAESGVLGAIAAVAGLALTSVFLRALIALSPADLPRLDDVRIDATVFQFAMGLSAISTVLLGLVPAVHASRLELSDALKQGGSKGAATAGGSPRLRGALVVGEVALSVVLLVAAGLLLRSFQSLQRVDLGFTTDQVLVVYTQYPASNDEDRRSRTQFYADFVERLRGVPGVTAAGGVSFLPLGREFRAAGDYFVQGRPEGQPGERPKAELNAITPGYFTTLGIPLRAGRDFDRTDTRDRPRVAIINETLARQAFPGESPLGRRVRRGANGPWMEIVGVAADTRWQDPSQLPPAVIFAASAQGVGGSLSLLALTSLDETALAGTVRGLLREANPNVPVRFETMDALFMEALAYPRFRTQLIGGFAGVAALLAGVGIFSVLAYLVGQRTREIAVRRAVGATATDVVRLIVGHGLRLIAIGLALGLAGAVGIGRLLEGLLYEITPWDAGTYLGALGVLGVAALLATVIPAIRAATIDPFLALQQE